MLMRLMRQKFHLWVFWGLATILAVGLVLPGISLGSRPDAVALVDGEAVELEAYNRAVSNALDSERGRLGGELGEADSARIRRQVLDQMIEETLALAGLKKLGLRVEGAEIRQTLLSDPSFRDAQGNFDQNRYRQFLQMQAERGNSPEQTEAMIARSLKISRARLFWANSARVTPAESEAALRQLYRRARARLLVWEYKALQAGLKPDEEELRTYYSENRQRWAKPEQAKARHILIKADALTGTTNAKAKADELYTQLKKGGDFAALAKANSQDEGSAKRGGDLNWFSKGDMVPEFEAKAWNLGMGEIGEPVLSQFGWHIIKLEGKRPGFEPTFENSRAKAQEAFTEDKARREARQLSARAQKLVEGGTSLEEAAKQCKARLAETGWFSLEEKSLLSGLGDSSSLAEELLYLETGENMASPASLEKGLAYGRLSAEQPGSLPKDAAKLAEKRKNAAMRLRSRKATALYESWLKSLRAEAKIVDRFDKFYGK